MTIPEQDWRRFRNVHDAALERFCDKTLEECAQILQNERKSAHERYLQVYALLRERDDELSAAFDDLRRSTAIRRLAAMIHLCVVTDDELAGFTDATRKSAVGLVELWGATESA